MITFDNIMRRRDFIAYTKYMYGLTC